MFTCRANSANIHSHATAAESRPCWAARYTTTTPVPVRTWQENKAVAVAKVLDSRAVVPAGRYALGDERKPELYLVNRPDSGDWAGFTFVTRITGGGDFPVKGSYKARVLAEIGADPKAAMLLYGRSEHHCGHCGRLIINDESIERGIGPVCAGRMGW